MPGLHLSHKLPWHQLVDAYQSYKYPPIKLPVGKCKKIHVINSKIKNKLKNRKYLDDKVCHNDECETVGETYFRKSLKRKNSLFERNSLEEGKELKKYFFEKFKSTVFEFIQTMQLNNKCNSDDSIYPTDQLSNCQRCDSFIQLLETKNFLLLEKYNIKELKEVFFCCHGGQAVGTNLPFLFYHVFYVYMITNIIFASNNINDTLNWYYMKPGGYFRGSLMYSCDGQTFLPSLRKYLKDDVYFKDLDATKELCKRCFEFICMYTMMEGKVKSNLTLDQYSDLI